MENLDTKRNMNIVFSSGLDRLTEYNSSFDKGVLRVCYTGQNRKNIFLDKETIEANIKSIYNCPIVCHYDRDTDTIGGHDMDIVSNADGGMRLVNMTHPIGIVPESAEYWWEEIEDDSGLHEYLCVEVILWKRQEAYQKIKRDGVTKESMEIAIKRGKMVNGVYVIYDFEFTAFCLLESVEPCFESAALHVFSCDDFKEQFAQMMEEIKSSFSSEQLTDAAADTPLQNKPKGGENEMDENETMNTNEKANEVQVDEHEAAVDASFSLDEAFRDELIQTLNDAETADTCFGEMPRYSYFDHDRDKMEVYCYDCTDWKLYGFAYAMNGDAVVINFESKKRKKIAIADFDEGEKQSLFSRTIETVANKFSENEAAWTEKYAAASGKITEMQSELEELRQFKASADDAARTAERESVLAQFDDLNGIEAFEMLRNGSDALTGAELEEKCYAIRGRSNSYGKFSITANGTAKAPKLPIVQKDTAKTTEPYGGIFSEYGFAENGSHN